MQTGVFKTVAEFLAMLGLTASGLGRRHTQITAWLDENFMQSGRTRTAQPDTHRSLSSPGAELNAGPARVGIGVSGEEFGAGPTASMPRSEGDRRLERVV
jgi:hypothetical protein